MSTNDPDSWQRLEEHVRELAAEQARRDRQRTAAFHGLLKITRDLATAFDGTGKEAYYREVLDTFESLFETAGGRDEVNAHKLR